MWSKWNQKLEFKYRNVESYQAEKHAEKAKERERHKEEKTSQIVNCWNCLHERNTQFFSTK